MADLFTDLCDGIYLCQLIEVLTGETLVLFFEINKFYYLKLYFNLFNKKKFSL